jgi:hypothetical protein
LLLMSCCRCWHNDSSCGRFISVQFTSKHICRTCSSKTTRIGEGRTNVAIILLGVYRTCFVCHKAILICTHQYYILICFRFIEYRNISNVVPD